MNNIKRTAFGKKLGEIRQKRGLTQKDIAKATNISQRMIAHYETRVEIPPIEKLSKIAQVLKISLDELVGLKEIRNFKPIKKRSSHLVNKLAQVEFLPKQAQKTILNTVNMFLKVSHLKKA